MFQGLTIEELINSVERVEQKTRQQQQEKTAADLRWPSLERFEWRETTEVA